MYFKSIDYWGMNIDNDAVLKRSILDHINVKRITVILGIVRFDKVIQHICF